MTRSLRHDANDRCELTEPDDLLLAVAAHRQENDITE